MIILMTTSRRPQQCYDHRLRDLVHSTGDVTIATSVGVPRSTARDWLGKAPTVVVGVDVTNRTASELQQEVLELRRRVKKLTALLRLALRPASGLGIHLAAQTSARRTRQSHDPASRRSCSWRRSVTGTPAVPAIVAGSVPCVAVAAGRVCAWRSIVLSAHVAPSSGVSRRDAWRNVLRQRRCGSSRPEDTRGRRTPGPPWDQPIGDLHDVPIINRRGRMITDSDHRDPRARALETTAGTSASTA